jgi:hypothetical protein
LIEPTAVYRLTSCMPDWFAASAADWREIVGTAAVPVLGGASDYVVDLTITGRATTVSVRETTPRIIRSFCPDRHVNEDLSFCLGYDVGRDVWTVDEAVVWWELLRNYLLLQRTADRTKRWPRGNGIAHGRAGKHHVEARAVAERLGILGQYDGAVAGDNHWSKDPMLRIAPNGQSLRNGRLRCPMGCQGRHGRFKLRRECTHRADVAKLLALERLRNIGEKTFWTSLKAQGQACCGTLKDCPLADSTN